MKRISSPGATINNLFTDGDPSLGIQATIIWAQWLNDLQEELSLSIEGLGGVVDGTAQNQLATRLKAYFGNAANLISGSLPAARFNDVAHGNRGNNNGAAHALVNATFAGFMSPFDFNKLAGLNGVPSGAITVWPTATPPTGWLECNGASLSTTTYAALYAVIGGQYGSGTGSFNLPDYRGEFLRGWDRGAGRDLDAFLRTNRGDGTTGDNVGTRQGDISGASEPSLLTTAYAPLTLGASAIPKGGTSSQRSSGGDVGNNPVGFTITTTVDGGETRPINVNVMYCIKY